MELKDKRQLLEHLRGSRHITSRLSNSLSETKIPQMFKIIEKYVRDGANNNYQDLSYLANLVAIFEDRYKMRNRKEEK